MQQTFPAGTAQKIFISNVEEHLYVIGREQQTITVESNGAIARLQPEETGLYIDGCEDTLKLTVPFETMILAMNVEGNVQIEGVLQVELRAIDDNVALQGVSGKSVLEAIDGNVRVENAGGEVAVSELAGDLFVNGASTVVAGAIEGDASLIRVARAELERVESDLVLDGVGEALIGRVDSDLRAKNGIASLRCGGVGGDCTIAGGGNALITLEYVGSDVVVNGAAMLQVGNVGSDCRVEGNASSEIQVGNVGSSISVTGAARVQVRNVGSDCVLRDIQGDVSLGHVGSDLLLTGVGGDLRVGHIGSDAQLKGMHGNILAGNIGSDLYLQADFPPESFTRLVVGSDATVVLPDDANLRLNASAGGKISGRSIVFTYPGSAVSLVYGEGAAQLDLRVGSDLTIRSTGAPRSSNSGAGASWESWDDWGRDFGRQWTEFGREMERMGRELGRELSSVVSEATSSLGTEVADDFAHSTRDRVHHAHRRAEEEIRRAEEKARRASEKAARFNIRIHDREWHMDSERLQRIIDQARRAADEGILGALEAVEQALSNLHIQAPPRPATPPPPPPAPGSTPPPPQSMPSAPDAPTPPTPPSPPENGEAVVVREEPQAERRAAHANLEQEREAILRMIAEGRITPEEGDLLLEALGE